MQIVPKVHPVPFPTSLDAVTFRFEDLPRQLRKIMDDALAGHDLGRTQWRLLAYVLREQAPTQTELARLLEVERATAGQAIDALERKGLVARQPKDGDRRVWCIIATPAAQQLLTELRVVVDEIYAQMFAGFSADEVAMLGRLLERIATNIRA
jgi:MarR family transcriptional regulator for hemolysin